MQHEIPQALSDDARETLQEILGLCERLLQVGDTQLVFTSREALPAPFDAERNRRELHRLDRDDAVKLIERVLNATGNEAGAANDAAREEIEELVDAVHGHVRTLSLLAPVLRSRGVTATRESLAELMIQMEKDFPGNREQSVFASIELSLRRLSEVNRDRVRVLGVFHGGFHPEILRAMMQWEVSDVTSLVAELIQTGLATPNRYSHLTLNPALCPYLRRKIDEAERESLSARWIEAMKSYVWYLTQQRNQNAELVTTLTLLELPNLFTLLNRIKQIANAEATIDLTSSLQSLLHTLGKSKLLALVGQLRDDAVKMLGDNWNHAHFEAMRTSIEHQLDDGKLRDAQAGAQALLQRTRVVGEQAYQKADFDLAMACALLAKVLLRVGKAEQALPLAVEAQKRFGIIAKACSNRIAIAMISVCYTVQGDCFFRLGKFDEAAKAYEENIRCPEQIDSAREVAVAKGQLGAVYLAQHRYQDALKVYEEARERFIQLNEPGCVAVSWFQTGRVYEEVNQPEDAEGAYLKSLTIYVQLGNVDGEASALAQLGLLYDSTLGRTEESIAFLRQALDKYIKNSDIANEGKCRSNLAVRLRKLRRLEEARREINRATECNRQFGHDVAPWFVWNVLFNIETDAGNFDAATVAKQKAMACYLAYRRDGGENHSSDGRIGLAVTQSLLAGSTADAMSLLKQYADNPGEIWLLPFIRTLQTIAAGSRDRTLADASDLNYSMAAEILFLIETLEKSR